jgi:hypothetical protein
MAYHKRRRVACKGASWQNGPVTKLAILAFAVFAAAAPAGAEDGLRPATTALFLGPCHCDRHWQPRRAQDDSANSLNRQELLRLGAGEGGPGKRAKPPAE